jgi:hypothetical protein
MMLLRVLKQNSAGGRPGVTPIRRKAISPTLSKIESEIGAELPGTFDEVLEYAGNLGDFPDLGQTEVRPSLTTCYNVLAGLIDDDHSYPTGLRPSYSSPFAKLPAALVSMRFRFLLSTVFGIEADHPFWRDKADSMEAASEHRTTEPLGSSRPRRKSGCSRS